MFLAINSAVMQATATEGLQTIKEEVEELGPPSRIQKHHVLLDHTCCQHRLP